MWFDCKRQTSNQHPNKNGPKQHCNQSPLLRLNYWTTDSWKKRCCCQFQGKCSRLNMASISNTGFRKLLHHNSPEINVPTSIVANQVTYQTIYTSCFAPMLATKCQNDQSCSFSHQGCTCPCQLIKQSFWKKCKWASAERTVCSQDVKPWLVI